MGASTQRVFAAGIGHDQGVDTDSMTRRGILSKGRYITAGLVFELLDLGRAQRD